MEYLTQINNSGTVPDYIEQNPLLFNHIKKVKVNLDVINSQPNFRAYKDESTSNFVNEFFKDEDTLSYFIFYTFNMLHYYIISNINKELSKFKEVIKSNEEIFVLFKGGNIIHFYFDKIINLIKKNISDNQNDSNVSEELKDFDKYFKISDVDTSVYIINNDEQKYNLIYYWVTILLSKSLIHIRNEFEKILTNSYVEEIITNNFDDKQYKLIDSSDKFDIYSIHTLYNDVAMKFENIENITNKKKTDFDSATIVTEVIESINNILKLGSKLIPLFNDCYLGSRYIMILQMIKFYLSKIQLMYEDKNVTNFFNNIDKTINYQDIIVKKILANKLSKIKNFYTEDSVNNFITNLTTKLNGSDYRDKKFYNQNIKPVTCYSITEQIGQKDVFVDKKGDFIFRNVNTVYYNQMIAFNDKNTHFISVNNTICNDIGNNIVSFDLFRIKFGVKLKKIKNITSGENTQLFIPSEFLDISIPKFLDLNLVELRKKIFNDSGKGYMEYFSKLENKKIGCLNILSTNVKYSIKDLNSVLYEQNTFIPWNDLKYNKRIIRLLFLIFIVYFKKADEYKSIDLISNVLDKFIDNLKELSSNIRIWFNDQNESNKNNVLSSINKIILFNDDNNNILNANTLRNFFDYQNKLFFKIRYVGFEYTLEQYDIINKIIHGELDLSINIITKIIFFVVEDYKVYEYFLLKNLNEYNYIFNSEKDKLNYINTVFLKDYVEFIDKFVKNISQIKEIIFKNAPINTELPTTNLSIGSGSPSTTNILTGGFINNIRTGNNYLQLNNNKLTDFYFNKLKNSNSNTYFDNDAFDML